MKNLVLILLYLSLGFTSLGFATPKEIIIIRHADKLVQSDPGPTLSAKGLARSIQFAFYYLDKFSEPDFIFTTDPIKESGKNSSIRELQTVAPLANMLAQKHPEQGFNISHPYASSDYKKLANELITKNKFDGKRILICWNHKKIPELVEALGVQENVAKWPSEDFDSVYLLKFKNNGELDKFEILNQQYPIVDAFSWEQMRTKLL